MLWRHVCVCGTSVILATGCAEHLQLLEQGGGGGAATALFWPPPPATSFWAAEPLAPGAEVSLGQAADRVATALRDAGYTDARWYPVGARYAHGFAVTTRLERIEDDGAHAPATERWSALFPEAPDLRWLARAREPRLPAPGR